MLAISTILCLASGLSLANGSIEVIGAGFGRTGTLSLSAALEKLGYRPYHYIDFSHAAQWAAHAKGNVTDDEIIDLVVESGYTATVENPTADLYASILRRFPNAKVVLTVRDNPVKFEQSWKTLFDTMDVTERPFSLGFPSFFQWIPLFRHLKDLRCEMGKHLGLSPCELTNGWRNKPDGWLGHQYEAHNAQVIATVPKDRLLVFNVKEGWEPLCHFLGRDVPYDEPFPNASVGINDATSLQRLRTIFLLLVYGWIPLLLLFSIGVVGCVKKRCGLKQKCSTAKPKTS